MLSCANDCKSHSVCLLKEDELKEAGLKEGGVLTPATAMGMPLLHRLRKAGISFDIQ